MTDPNSTLVSVRCPNKRTRKNGVEIVCNWLCVKVQPGAKGEAFCSQCKLTFGFEVERGYKLPDTKQNMVAVKKS